MQKQSPATAADFSAQPVVLAGLMQRSRAPLATPSTCRSTRQLSRWPSTSRPRETFMPKRTPATPHTPGVQTATTPPFALQCFRRWAAEAGPTTQATGRGVKNAEARLDVQRPPALGRQSRKNAQLSPPLTNAPAPVQTSPPLQSIQNGAPRPPATTRLSHKMRLSACWSCAALQSSGQGAVAVRALWRSRVLRV